MPQRWAKHHYVPFYRGGTKRTERKNPKQIQRRRREAFPYRRDAPLGLTGCRQLNFPKSSNSQFLGNTLKVLPEASKEKWRFELGFVISSFTFWAVEHDQTSRVLKNLSWTEGNVVWGLLKIHPVILEKELPATDSHLTFCSQWRKDELKLPLTW